VRADELDDRRLARLRIPHPIGVGAKPRLGEHVLVAECAKQPFGYRLNRGGDADIAPVLRAKDIAREVSDRLPVRYRTSPVTR
jgi:hypothetical protein